MIDWAWGAVEAAAEARVLHVGLGTQFTTSVNAWGVLCIVASAVLRSDLVQGQAGGLQQG